MVIMQAYFSIQSKVNEAIGPIFHLKNNSEIILSTSQNSDFQNDHLIYIVIYNLEPPMPAMISKFSLRLISFVNPMLKPLNLIIISVNFILVNFIVDILVEVNSITSMLIFPIPIKFEPNLCVNSNRNTK
jgi:hypothetical protein